MSDQNQQMSRTPSRDRIEYFLVVIQRLLEEPIGLILALFLALLFGLPSQIPDMIDPYFEWDQLGLVAFCYLLLSFWMGYTVWFWMIAAVRCEALIPGGRYYAPVGTKETGYERKFGTWYRPFNYAANFAALLALLACMSRPLYLLATWEQDRLFGYFVSICLFTFIWYLMFKRAFWEPPSKLIYGTIIIAAILYGYSLATGEFGVFIAVAIAVTAVLGAFTMVAIFDSQSADTDSAAFALSFKREDLSAVPRFSWRWNNRLTAILLASPHRFWWRAEDRPIYKVLRTVFWTLQVFGPVTFLLVLYFYEKSNILFAPPTPIAALLSLSMSVGPMVVFLALCRELIERFVLLLVNRKERRKRIVAERNALRIREGNPPIDPEKEHIEYLAYSIYHTELDDNGTQETYQGLRRISRFIALILMASIFFTDILESTHAQINYTVFGNDPQNADHDPAQLSYFLSRINHTSERVHQRPELATALQNWLTARPDVRDRIAKKPGVEIPVFIIAAAGGANRASVWSMAMLNALNTETGNQLNPHIFAFSGVSGGALGSLTYALYLERELAKGPSQWPLPKIADRDLLAPSVTYFFNVDLIKRFDLLPLRIGFSDRNEIIERTFEHSWNEDWGFSGHDKDGLLALHNSSAGRMPQLLLNGVDSRSGRRVLTSTMQINRSMFPEAQDFFDRFNHDIRPATAVMNSARFPLISPAGRYHARVEDCTPNTAEGLGCAPAMRHQIIDGGYYENSGVQTAYELARAIENLSDTFAREQNWKPIPVIIAISNAAAGPIAPVSNRSVYEWKQINGDLVYHAPDGDLLPRFRDVTPTCANRDDIEEFLFPDADAFATELGAIIRGVTRTNATHNHRSLNHAMAQYCAQKDAKGLRQLDRFLHFGLPMPLNDSHTAPMNWVLSDRARAYLTEIAPKSVLRVQSESVGQLRGLLGANSAN